MELKFLLLTVIPLFAIFERTEAQSWNSGSQPHHGNNNTFGAPRPQATPSSPTYGGNTQNPIFVPFRQPNTYPPPIYTANAFGTSSSSTPPPRWSGSHPSHVGHGQHGHNEHRYPSYNRTAGTTPGYGQNSNQFGNRDNPAGLYPSLNGLGDTGNTYRPPAQHNTHPNYPSGGNQHRPAPQGGTGTWNGTARSNFRNQPHNPQPNHQNAYGNVYRPAAQAGTGPATWNAATGSNYPNHQFNGHPNYQSGQAHNQYNQTAGRAPVNSGFGNQG